MANAVMVKQPRNSYDAMDLNRFESLVISPALASPMTK